MTVYSVNTKVEISVKYLHVPFKQTVKHLDLELSKGDLA